MMLSTFLKERRTAARLTQPDLAKKAGVGLRFVRDLEQGKETLRLSTVNQVLKLFGFELGPVALDRNRVLEKDKTTDETVVTVGRKKKRV